MRKWQNLCYPSPVSSGELDYEPYFAYGDFVVISWDSVTPKGMFYAGLRGVVIEIDTRWTEYSYCVLLDKEQDWYVSGSFNESIWIKESDLDYDWDVLVEEEPEPEPEPVKRGRGRPKKTS